MVLSNYEILVLSRELMIEIHRLTLQLSNMQVFDSPSGLADPVYSVTSAIVGGGIKKYYSYEFIKELVTEQSATNSDDQLETLLEKGTLTRENLYKVLKTKLELLGKMINGLKQSGEAGTERTK